MATHINDDNLININNTLQGISSNAADIKNIYQSLTTLEARLNAIIANTGSDTGTVEKEVIDIRTRIGGTASDTAGQAIRDQLQGLISPEQTKKDWTAMTYSLDPTTTEEVTVLDESDLENIQNQIDAFPTAESLTQALQDIKNLQTQVEAMLTSDDLNSMLNAMDSTAIQTYAVASSVDSPIVNVSTSTASQDLLQDICTPWDAKTSYPSRYSTPAAAVRGQAEKNWKHAEELAAKESNTRSTAIKDLNDRISALEDSPVFNTGIWKSSICNGTTIVPKTKFKITPKMTHAEVYKVLHNAGMCPGIYRQSSSKSSNKEANHKRIWPSFTCLDYNPVNTDIMIPVDIFEDKAELELKGNSHITLGILPSEKDNIYYRVITAINSNTILLQKISYANKTLINEGLYTISLAEYKTWFASDVRKTAMPLVKAVGLENVDCSSDNDKHVQPEITLIQKNTILATIQGAVKCITYTDLGKFVEVGSLCVNNETMANDIAQNIVKSTVHKLFLENEISYQTVFCYTNNTLSIYRTYNGQEYTELCSIAITDANKVWDAVYIDNICYVILDTDTSIELWKYEANKDGLTEGTLIASAPNTLFTEMFTRLCITPEYLYITLTGHELYNINRKDSIFKDITSEITAPTIKKENIYQNEATVSTIEKACKDNYVGVANRRITTLVDTDSKPIGNMVISNEDLTYAILVEFSPKMDATVIGSTILIDTDASSPSYLWDNNALIISNASSPLYIKGLDSALDSVTIQNPYSETALGLCKQDVETIWKSLSGKVYNQYADKLSHDLVCLSEDYTGSSNSLSSEWSQPGSRLLLNTEDSELRLGSMYPILSATAIKVTEDSDNLYIYILGCSQETDASSAKAFGTLYNISGNILELDDATKVKPAFIIHKEDNTTVIGSTIYWDFPAQLSVNSTDL